MGTSGNFTLFSPGSQTAGSSGDYVKDAFQDISLVATNNTTLTSTALTNPINQNFANPDAPKFGAKTLWIQDLVLIEDRSKWVNNKPTYEVIFQQSYPGVFAYVYGNVRLRNYAQGKCVEIRNIDDAMGVSGVVRRVMWILNPTQLTGTADLVTDGVDTAVDATFGSSAVDSESEGYNHFAGFVHQTTNATKDIHDYRLQANETNTLKIAGVVVYHENATNNVDLFPGATYVDKIKNTTTSLTAQALATVVGSNGARTLIYKTSNNTYAANTVETQSLSTVGSGNSSSTSVTVTTGQGASFPAGSGIVGVAGTSFYVGSVQSVSTDTLTVSPALGITLLSSAVYKSWWAGPTLAINASLYAVSFQFDPGLGNVALDGNGFGKLSTGDFYFSDPLKRYRIWGDQLKYRFIDGTPGVDFNGSTVGFYQADGMFSAVELELAGGASGVMHGTFSVNGTPVFGLNEALRGSAKKTVFTDAGPGWNSFYFSVGSSHLDVAVSKINFYNRDNQSVTLGLLAAYNTMVNQVQRTAVNATLHQLGTHQRIFADEMFLTGAWTRGITTTMAGGIYYGGASTNSVATIQYYGKDFALIGTAGASCSITVDGASIANNFNVMKSVASLTFHTVQYTHLNGSTTLINAFDYTRTTGEFRSLQNFLPRSELDKPIQVIQSSDTPRNPKPGTIWAQSNNLGAVWVYLFDKWNKLSITQSSDDPNVGVVLIYGGAT